VRRVDDEVDPLVFAVVVARDAVADFERSIEWRDCSTCLAVRFPDRFASCCFTRSAKRLGKGAGEADTPPLNGAPPDLLRLVDLLFAGSPKDDPRR